MSKPIIICLMPVKNEAWILERSLKCNSIWADHIIIADQSDNDECKAIAAKFPKVTYIVNSSKSYSEHERQTLLLQEARKYPKPRILLSIDADEVLSANCMESPEWGTMLEQKEGTVFAIQRIEIREDLQSCWCPTQTGYLRGMVDTGEEYHGIGIHGNLLPFPSDAPWLLLKDLKILHYQFADWKRMQSKHRWYLCWEKLVNSKGASVISMYRTYHHMNSVTPSAILPLRSEWFAGYEKQNIDMTSIYKPPIYWYDEEVLNWFIKYGTKVFSKEAIWDVNWVDIAKKAGIENPSRFGDPRGIICRAVHRWLRETQPNYKDNWVSWIDNFLKKIGW